MQLDNVKHLLARYLNKVIAFVHTNSRRAPEK